MMAWHGMEVETVDDIKGNGKIKLYNASDV